MSIRRLGLIVWKNFQLRKRQYIVSLLEIVLPILGVLIAFMMSQADTLGSIAKSQPMQTFNIMTEEELMKPFGKWCSDPSSPPSIPPIAYTPINPETTQVMTLVSSKICELVQKSGEVVNLDPLTDENMIDMKYKMEKFSNESEFCGAVVFTDGLKELKPGGSGKDRVLPYTIRMFKVPSIKYSFPKRNEHSILYKKPSGGPSSEFFRFGPNIDYGEKYVNSGFIGLQLAIDKVLKELITGKDFSRGVSIQPFPYPAHPIPREKIGKSTSFFLFCTWGFCFMIPSITKNIVGEKQTGIQELLRLTGVSGWIQWVGWLIHVVTPHLFTITFITILVCTPLIGRVKDDTPFRFADPTFIWTVFFLYILATTTFCFMICALCQNPVIATSVAEIVFVFTLLTGFVYGVILQGLFKKDVKIGISVFPNLALAVLLDNIFNLEWAKLDERDAFAGARWSTLNVVVTKGDEKFAVSNLEIMLVLLCDILVYGLLALYLDSVLPSEHGVKRPWYLFEFGGQPRQYPVASSQVAPMVSTETDLMAGASSNTVTGENEHNNKGFEPEPQDVPVGIDIRGVSKRFGGKVAVNGVSLRMFTGDIFALLGHNGAGKTTLISMISGFFAPTSGTAVIEGYDIRTDLEKVRHNMGLCPQHNMLFENLGVADQLRLFGMLRGLTWKQAKTESNILLSKMAFLEKASTAAKNLSGGQKRKLCLAIALIGGTKVVILDEPTSGMDPQARREIWDILLQLRGERTILLTTHFMEEADCLGDRIGIMANGMVQCCGTTAFLKKYYGAGYTLKLTLYGRGGKTNQNAEETPTESTDQVQVMSSDEARAILVVIQKNIPNATFKKQARLDRESNEVFITLPSETATTAALTEMFGDLTARKEKLGINTIGLQQTTMDEVFLVVGALAEEEKYGVSDHDASTEEETFERAPKVSGARFGTQFMSLVTKKSIWSTRKWVMITFMAFIPLAIFVVFVLLVNLLAEPKTKPITIGNSGPGGRMSRNQGMTGSGLLLRLSEYSSPTTLYSDPQNNLPQFLDEFAFKKVESSVEKALIKAANNDIVNYKRKDIVAFNVEQSDLIAMFNQYPFHAAPLAINIATNTLLKEDNSNFKINVTTQPFGSNSNDNARLALMRQYPGGRMPPPPPNNNYSQVRTNTAFVIPLILGAIASLGIIIFVAIFVVNPIEENNCKVKQLQTMTGVSPFVYWLATFLWDYFIYSLVILAILICCLIFDLGLGYGVLSWGYGWLALVTILMLHGFPGILFAYLISFRSSTVAGGFSLVTLLNLFSGLFLRSFEAISFPGGAGISIGGLFPAYLLVRAVSNFLDIAVENSNCRLLHEPVDECERDKNLPASYVAWSRIPAGIPGTNSPTRPTPSVGQDIIAMILLGIFYFFVIMIIEWRICKKLCKRQGNPNEFPPNIYDDDVFNEMQRVNDLVSSGQVETECLVVQNLCKSFGAFAAVSQLHFGVHYGECFGLLGVNGAGKTTAFRMITGDEVPSLGTAYGFGTSLDKNRRRFFSNIGYCPQFDAILPNFTGKEMLQLFAGLRGVPFKLRGQEATRWLTRMGLIESANAKCGRYSGGMKRRLSTAMAMIGDPTLILLDEPTSGVDPVSRRQFWKILDKLRESGQSIILTSHSMEECEALCARLGIMVNGQFQCFGGVQHLKSKFAQGYSLTLKLKPDLPFETEECKEQLGQLEEAISQRFQPCVLKDKHQNLLQYHLSDPSITWDVLFKTMEKLKADFGNLIEDYSVNETSLEEVFLAFARAQYAERRANVSLCKQICTCSC